VSLTGGVSLMTDLVVRKAPVVKPVDPALLAAVRTAPSDQCAPLPNGVVCPIRVLTPVKEADDLAAIGECLLDEDPVAAREYAVNAIAGCPESHQSHLLLGRSSAALGLERDAVAEFQIAALLSPTRANAVVAQRLAEEAAARITSDVGHLVEVCRWADRYPICVPSEWLEVTAPGVDSNSSRIFASRPSRVLDWDPLEMVLATQIPAPDFSSLIEAAMYGQADQDIQIALYESAVPDLFEALLDATMRSIALIQTEKLTIVRGSMSGELDDANFIQEHMFIIPRDGSVPPGTALLVLVSYEESHDLWMREICDGIFDLLIGRHAARH
jgi:hypothetical protein